VGVAVALAVLAPVSAAWEGEREEPVAADMPVAGDRLPAEGPAAALPEEALLEEHGRGSRR